jgi:hypothetical protein
MVALSYPKHSPNCVLILTSAGDLGWGTWLRPKYM